MCQCGALIRLATEHFTWGLIAKFVPPCHRTVFWQAETGSVTQEEDRRAGEPGRWMYETTWRGRCGEIKWNHLLCIWARRSTASTESGEKKDQVHILYQPKRQMEGEGEHRERETVQCGLPLLCGGGLLWWLDDHQQATWKLDWDRKLLWDIFIKIDYNRMMEKRGKQEKLVFFSVPLPAPLLPPLIVTSTPDIHLLSSRNNEVCINYQETICYCHTPSPPQLQQSSALVPLTL